tara:strand:- start:136 stop:900 length:765 start_codon:yes stop_codon:yes gene_type:complete
MKKKLFLIFLFLIFSKENFSRSVGETEIFTDEGIEVFQNEKFYLLKKNVRIVADDFKLTGDEVKIYFEKDLYDIVNIQAKGNVDLNSKIYKIKSSGKSIDIKILDEEITVTGEGSELFLENVKMSSDGKIIVNNLNGAFKIIGSNSFLNSEDIYITGNDIDGIFSTTEKREVLKLNVQDEVLSNIKTDDLDMYAKKAIYNKETSIIELFDNVKIIRGSEIITGDYGTLDTKNNSYKVKSNNSNKVKVLITENDE